MVRRPPLRNRVTATGEIVADPARGLFMGNRGILHDETGTVGARRWRHRAWITCRLVWKDWHRKLMQPGAYTELFFLDEAVALAAGHRPCALCRRDAYRDYILATGHGGNAAALDAQLHAERAVPRRNEQRRHRALISTLPDGAIVLEETGPALVLGDVVRSVTLSGYGPARARAWDEVAAVLTPPTSLAALRAGYRPELHPTAT